MFGSMTARQITPHSTIWYLVTSYPTVQLNHRSGSNGTNLELSKALFNALDYHSASRPSASLEPSVTYN